MENTNANLETIASGAVQFVNGTAKVEDLLPKEHREFDNNSDSDLFMNAQKEGNVDRRLTSERRHCVTAWWRRCASRGLLW